MTSVNVVAKEAAQISIKKIKGPSEKASILSAYEDQFASHSQDSILTKKRGKHNIVLVHDDDDAEYHVSKSNNNNNNNNHTKVTSYSNTL